MSVVGVNTKQHDKVKGMILLSDCKLHLKLKQELYRCLTAYRHPRLVSTQSQEKQSTS